jgi:predicted dehydrogenase
MPDGIIASVDLSWSAPQSRNILEVQGTGGLVELWWGGGRFSPAAGEAEEFQWPTDPVAADPFAAQLSWFLRAIDGEVAPRATVEDGVRALEVVAAAYASAAGPAWTDTPVDS